MDRLKWMVRGGLCCWRAVKRGSASPCFLGRILGGNSGRSRTLASVAHMSHRIVAAAFFFDFPWRASLALIVTTFTWSGSLSVFLRLPSWVAVAALV